MSKEIVWSAVKEPLRLLVLALIPLLLVYLGTLSYEWAGALILLLRALDSILHKIGKAREEAGQVSSLTNGLTRF